MTDSTFTFEEGEPIVVGSAGEHDYVFEEGTPVTDSGVSTLVFESGTGLGGQFIVNGVSLDPFEGTQSIDQFWDYTDVFSDEDKANAQGLVDAGVPLGDGVLSVYVFLYHKTDTDEWYFCAWQYGDEQDQNLAPEAAANIDYNGLGNPPTAVQDDPGSGDSQPDTYTTNGAGDARTENAYELPNGDGVAYSLGSSFSASGSVEITGQHPDFTDLALPGRLVGRSPTDSTTVSGSSITYQVSV